LLRRIDWSASLHQTVLKKRFSTPSHPQLSPKPKSSCREKVEALVKSQVKGFTMESKLAQTKQDQKQTKLLVIKQPTSLREAETTAAPQKYSAKS